MRTFLGIVRVVSLAVLTLAALPREAAACSCMPSGPPCQAYFQSDAVFVGTVRSIELRKTKLEAVDFPVDRRVVHLTVERTARGVQGADVDVVTGTGGGDCGYDFKVGERYVVYAHRGQDGSLGTGICSRTRPLGEAAEDLAYVSAIPSTGRGAEVLGTVKHWERNAETGKSVEELIPDVQVLVRGSKGVFSGMTGADGRYTIPGVPPGSYETEVLPPPQFSPRHLSRKFDIKDPRACQVEDFGLQYAGRVAGVVLDAADQPAAQVRVEIARASAPDDPIFLDSSATATTDSNGLFELVDVQPGSYVVGVGLTTVVDPAVVYHRTVFPRAIEVGKGNRVEVGTLHLPQPSRRYELTGVAVGADGVPIAGASVYLQGQRFRQATTAIRTAADGSFALPVFEGQSYTVRAYVNVTAAPVRQASAQEAITISGQPSPIRLVLVVR
jgi:hypothetical protein